MRRKTRLKAKIILSSELKKINFNKDFQILLNDTYIYFPVGDFEEEEKIIKARKLGLISNVGSYS